MKKRFTLKVMYGDADGYETFKYISDNEDEINFLTYFLGNYTKDLFLFYDNEDLSYSKTFMDNERKLVEIVNNLTLLSSKICNENIPELPIGSTTKEIYEALSENINFVSNYFDWCMYHCGMDYNGCPVSYKIEDITGSVVMTKRDVVTMIKEKLGVDIVIID